MAKFYGKIGYGENVEKAQGVWDDTIVEYSYRGDVVRNTLKVREGEPINNDLTVGNSISILADAYASKHISAMRYVEWSGSLWTISEVEVQRPRLLLRLGGVYNGPVAAPGSP